MALLESALQTTPMEHQKKYSDSYGRVTDDVMWHWTSRLQPGYI